MKTKPKNQPKPNEKAYIVYLVFNERTKLTDYPAPTRAFFYAILMIINWQWLMASTEVIEDTTAPFYPIQFSIFLWVLVYFRVTSNELFVQFEFHI